MNEVLLLSLYAVLCPIGIFGILEYISWYHFIFLATSSFSWSIQASSVVLDILCLLVYDFSIGFIPKSFSCLEYRFFLLYTLLHCLPILVCPPFSILSELLILSYCFFRFLSTVWFLLNITISASILTLLVYSSSLSILIFLLLSFVFTWFFLDKISTLIYIFLGMYCKMKL